MWPHRFPDEISPKGHFDEQRIWTHGDAPEQGEQRAYLSFIAVGLVAAVFCIWLLSTATRPQLMIVLVLTMATAPLYRLYVRTSRQAPAPQDREQADPAKPR